MQQDINIETLGILKDLGCLDGAFDIMTLHEISFRNLGTIRWPLSEPETLH